MLEAGQIPPLPPADIKALLVCSGPKPPQSPPAISSWQTALQEPVVTSSTWETQLPDLSQPEPSPSGLKAKPSTPLAQVWYIAPSSWVMCPEGEVWQVYASQPSPVGPLQLKLLSRVEVKWVDDPNRGADFYSCTIVSALSGPKFSHPSDMDVTRTFSHPAYTHVIFIPPVSCDPSPCPLAKACMQWWTNDGERGPQFPAGPSLITFRSQFFMQRARGQLPL